MAAILWILGVVIIVFYILLRPARHTKTQMDMMRGVNFAHRGLHSSDKTVPENSLAAFSAAAETGYGIELDIQLSKDGAVVVFHDDELARVTGKEGRVDAYTLQELRKMHLCNSEQGIPLFTEVLKAVNGRVPIIIELKTGTHNAELCRKALRMMRRYEGPFCIESFDPRIVRYFRRNAPEILRGQLSDKASSFTGKPLLLRLALGNLFTNVLARPQFIAYGPGRKSIFVHICEAMGAIRVCWTVRGGDDVDAKQAANDAVIFEHYLPLVNYMQ